MDIDYKKITVSLAKAYHKNSDTPYEVHSTVRFGNLKMVSDFDRMQAGLLFVDPDVKTEDYISFKLDTKDGGYLILEYFETEPNEYMRQHIDL